MICPMNETPKTESCGACQTRMIYIVAILGTFLIMGWMSRLMLHRTGEGGVDTKKAQERWKNIGDFKAANQEALENYGWQDPSKGLVRLKIERAMELTVQQGKNPQEARANLISRVEKATAPPPKPNYE